MSGRRKRSTFTKRRHADGSSLRRDIRERDAVRAAASRRAMGTLSRMFGWIGAR